jgi:hypothetical protein
MSETIGRLLAVGNVAEVFECGSRVLKLYRNNKAFRIHVSVLPVFVATVTAFGLRSNQSRRVRDATDQRGRPARVIGCPRPMS